MAEEFVKTRNGIKAPRGFHYMPNGKLMSDADHVAVHGYIDKRITGFNIDTRDVSYLGGNKYFTINGDNGAIFSLEIYDDDSTPNYYNFVTKEWSSTKSGLYNVELQEDYSSIINFPPLGFTLLTCDYDDDPTVTHDVDSTHTPVAGMLVEGTGIPNDTIISSITSTTEFELSTASTGGAVTNGSLKFSKLKKYTIELRAETAHNIKTTHVALSEKRNSDGSVNLNESTGSDGNVLTKILHQDTKKYLYLSLVTPKGAGSFSTTVDGAVSSANKIITDVDLINDNAASNVSIGDLVSGTGIATSIHALVTKLNPDGDNTKEVQISVADSIGDGVAINFFPATRSITPQDTDTTGIYSREVSSGEDIKTTFSITCTASSGRTITAFRTPTTSDLVVRKSVTFGSSALAILGEDTSSSTLYYRWPIDNITNLSEGMSLDPARSGGGANTITPALISPYSSSVSSTNVVDRKYYTDIESTSIVDVSVPGVDPYGNDVLTVDRNGRALTQAGNLTFNVQQPDALKSDSSVYIYAHGKQQIQTMTGMEVELSDVVITPTQVSTTTTGAVSSSTTIPVAEAAGISTASTIRGIGISPAAANPTVTLKSAATGAANLTASAAQTLESGQTLYFDGGSKIITITGVITVKNMAIASQTLYLDIDRFLHSI